ncbi:MAG: DUF1553 domain-containing protein, partial [Gemmataceae bacterium]|nr:DUF1553 domain-containing protein [Gemmataceae bacterium]MDW8267095.1 DUF1553 domain-containing protein [Gemmataceae bacterium]
MPNVGHWVGGAAVLWLASVAAATSPDRAGVEFFEQKIRPVLVKHCYSCHSAEAKKVKGGLLLDTRAGMLKGGDTGPAVVPFKVEESLVIKALRHDELAMPPSTKLPDDVIGDFERWIRLGAPDPRDGQLAVSKPAIDLEAGRKFWSFQPLRATPPPTVRDTAWPWTDIDRFLLAALEARGLKPTRDADRETLVRRVTIALTGLPPTPDELDEVCHDPSPAWFERLVDRLLASPHFGERWGRHWLDVARYADSNGKDENLTFHEAFRYRDYVIQAFNTDKPFDRFLIEQLAGDLLPADSPQQRDEQLTATGFLVVGPKVLADRDVVKRRADVIDEQLDTMGRAFLGMTLGCARCHDHKFDPIPSSDYYALAGIFGSTRTLDGIKAGNAVISGWMLRPLGPDGEARWAAHKEHQKKLAALAGQIKKLRDELKGHEDKATMRVPSRLIGFTVDDKEAQLIGTWKPSTFSRPYVGDGYIHDDKSGKGEKSATFTPKLPKAGEYEVFLAYTPGKGRATNVPVTIRHASGETTVRVNQEERPPLDNLFRSVGTFRFEAGSSGSVTISNQGTIGYVIVDAVRFVPTGALGKDPEMAMGVPAEVKEKIADVQARLKALEAEERALKAASPPEPELVMAVRDEDTIEDMRIHLRGNPHALGDVVPRGFLSVLSVGPRPTLPPNQSGRVELAQWLVGPAQPLTSRVFVNRVWKHLFGEGLVRTVDNFGTQGEPPTHPELLDELARRFIADGWSVKKLIRAILLSHAYRLSADAEPALVRADPDNRLFGRACRRRVEAEVIRDSILAVAGTLDRTMGGSSVTNLGERAIDNSSQGGLQAQMESSVRRSVYLPIIRNELPKVFEVFDFADADVSTGRRDTTTVPTQALYLLNSPFVLAQAQQTARRLLALPTDDAGRLTDLYRRALGRRPSAPERAAAPRRRDHRRPT